MADGKNIMLQIDKGTAILTLNRPNALNALNMEVLHELSATLDAIKEDDTVRVLIITGSGQRAFSAGADIRFLSKAHPLEVRDMARLAVVLHNKIESLGKIVVAAINGFALGGGLELAEACMLRVAATTAWLGHPEVRIGAMAGWGGTTRLPRLIGKGRAAELLLTGKMISADEAYRIGLVNRVAPPDMLLPETKELIKEILTQAPVAVNMTWEAMHRGMNMSLEESTQLGADYFGLLASTEDFKEGTRSFLEKSTPSFKGR